MLNSYLNSLSLDDSLKILKWIEESFNEISKPAFFDFDVVNYFKYLLSEESFSNYEIKEQKYISCWLFDRVPFTSDAWSKLNPIVYEFIKQVDKQYHSNKLKK